MINSNKKTILAGIKELAKIYNAKLDDLSDIVVELLKDIDGDKERQKDHIVDFIFDPSLSVDDFLERLEKWT